MSINLPSIFGPTEDPGKPLSMPVVFFDDFIGTSFGVDVSGASHAKTATHFAETGRQGTWLVSGDNVASSYVYALDGFDGGVTAFSANGATGERTNCQVNGEAFLMAPDRRMLFKTRISVLNASANWFVGLMDTDGDAYQAALTGAEACIGFAGSTSTTIQTAADNAGGASCLVNTNSTFTAGTTEFFDLAWEWDGRSAIRYYVNGARVQTQYDTGAFNLPIGEYLTPTICIEASEDTLETLRMDYFLVVNER